MLNAIDRQSTPGLYAQAVAAYLLFQDVPESEKKQLFHEMLDAVLECEGIKGKPEIIEWAVTKLAGEVQPAQHLLERFDAWKKQYIAPILEYRKKHGHGSGSTG
jgi:hypothetical protein